MLFIVFVFLKLIPGIFEIQNGDCSVKVQIENIKDSNGSFIVSLFDKEENFLEKDVKTIVIKASEYDSKGICFNGIQAGTYAIAIIHDVDLNGELNTALYGIPSEPYGFSNNAKGMMGPPDFKTASFKYEGNNTVIQSIRLK